MVRRHKNLQFDRIFQVSLESLCLFMSLCVSLCLFVSVCNRAAASLCSSLRELCSLLREEFISLLEVDEAFYSELVEISNDFTGAVNLHSKLSETNGSNVDICSLLWLTNPGCCVSQVRETLTD